jgi:Fe-S-cluster containining protein
MNLSAKLAVLEKIYKVYDEFTTSLDLACKKGCAHCCTTSVILTTVEGYKIFKALESEGNSWWIDRVLPASAHLRFQPKITTNQLANLCAEGIEPPTEESTEWKQCPILINRQCPIYHVRPFSCRCLVSRNDCGKQGYADMDDFVLSVNTIFLQIIEHLDENGCSGNLIDVLGVMASEKNRQAFENNALKCSTTELIANQPLKVLMIPPEHRTKMEPILKSLQDIRL